MYKSCGSLTASGIIRCHLDVALHVFACFGAGPGVESVLLCCLPSNTAAGAGGCTGPEGGDQGRVAGAARVPRQPTLVVAGKHLLRYIPEDCLV